MIFLFWLSMICLGPTAAQAPAPATLPSGFRDIRLGGNLAEVKEILKEEALLDYRGDPDVSFLPASAQSLIECRGTTYIKRAYLQFHEDRLFTIILALDEQRLDYYTLFRTLSQKYGDPRSLNPTEAVWSNDTVRLSLERPLIVKYIDLGVFDRLKEAGKAERELSDQGRDKFLNHF